MPTMQRKPSSYLDSKTFPKKEGQTITSLEGSLSIPKQSPHHPLEESPPNTKNTKRCLAKKSCKGYPDTPFGIMPSNCSWELLHHYLDNSFPLPKVKLLKRKSFWPNT